MTEQIAKASVPTGMIDVSSDTSVKPIDNKQPATAEIETELAEMLLHLIAFRKPTSPVALLDEQVAVGTPFEARRKCARTPYTTHARVLVWYSTSITSAAGTITITTTTDGTGLEYDVQPTQSTSNTEHWQQIDAFIEFGAGDATDLGVEEIIMAVENTGAGGTINIHAWLVIPQAQAILDVTP